MPAGALILALSIGLAGLVGFAAAHGGICAVRAVEDLLEGRGAALFLGFLKCAVWVALVTPPLAWTMVPGAGLACSYPLGWPVVVGGFLFGVGAAVNGGCAFSTVSHLAAGDLGAGFAMLGLGLGFALHEAAIGPLLPAPAPRPSALAHGEPWAIAIFAAAGVWAVREAVRLARPGPGGRVDRAMAAIGLAGGARYTLHGPWVYTAGLAQGVAWAVRVGPAPSGLIPLLFLGVLGGAALAARARGRLRLRGATRLAVARGLGGGALMGAGAALVPGGNDALVLHALPALAAHAALAYAALVCGAGTTLLAARVLRRVRPLRRSGWRRCHSAQTRPRDIRGRHSDTPAASTA
jgi:uncharacterized protein